MKDFDIAKFLRENQLGSYGILNHYVDLKPLKEEEIAEDVTPEDTAKVPYEGTQPRRDGFGDEFEQAETVSEENYSMGSEQDKLNSMLADSHPDIGSAADIISSTIKVLRNEKFSDQEIIDFLASLDSLDPSKF